VGISLVGTSPGTAEAREPGDLLVIGGGFHLSYDGLPAPAWSSAFEIGAGKQSKSNYFLATIGHQVFGPRVCLGDGGCYVGYTILDLGIEGGLFASRG